MKNFSKILLVVVSVLFFACAKETADTPIAHKQHENRSHSIPIETALGDLQAMLVRIDEGGTRSGGSRTVGDVELLSSKDMGMVSATRSGDGISIDSVIYIVNFYDDRGFAILAADDRLAPVLVIADYGRMTMADFNAKMDEESGDCLPDGEYPADEEDPFNYTYSSAEPTGNSFVANNIRGYVFDSFEQYRIPNEYEYFWGDWEFLEFVKPMTQMKWGQDKPFNLDCPIRDGVHAKTGCIATACAQIMATNAILYNIRPSRVYYNSCDYYDIDWDLLIKSINDHKGKKYDP